MSFAHLHAYSYAACLKQLPNTELAAVWGDEEERDPAAAAELGVPHIEDVNDFLDLDLDGVIICAENMRHHALAELAAEAGKWILCEKPLSPDVREAETMVRLCEREGVGLGTAFPCRFIPSVIEARKRIQNGDLGEILAVACTNHGQYPGGWFSDPRWSGGGAVMDHTVHVADVLRWILGKEFTSVYCELDNLFHAGEFDTDDLGSLHLEMEGGVQVSHLASWSRPKSFPTWGDVTLEFIGENGVINVDAFNQKLNIYSDEAVKAQWAYWGADPNLALVADFAEAVEARRAPAATGDDGLKASQITAAAYESAEKRKRVSIQ